MSYDAVEQGLLVLLRGLSDYTTGKNISRGDARILGKGVKKAIILYPGSIPTRSVTAAPRKISTEWEIIIELRVAFRGEVSTIQQDIITSRQDIIDHVDQYPTLNGISGVVQTFITGGAEPEVWQGESRNWWVQRLRCRVVENVYRTVIEST